jgi:hypothetical protein
MGRWMGALAGAKGLPLEGSGGAGVGTEGAETGMTMGDEGRFALSNRTRWASWSSRKSASFLLLFHARTNW